MCCVMCNDDKYGCDKTNLALDHGLWSPLLSGRIMLDDVGGCHSVRMTSRTSGILTSAPGDEKDIGRFFFNTSHGGVEEK